MSKCFEKSVRLWITLNNDGHLTVITWSTHSHQAIIRSDRSHQTKLHNHHSGSHQTFIKQSSKIHQAAITQLTAHLRNIVFEKPFTVHGLGSSAATGQNPASCLNM